MTSVRTSGDSETVPLAVWWGSGIGTRTARTRSCLILITVARPGSFPVVLRPFLLEEFRGTRDLPETVHAVFDGDPAAERHARQDAENRVVVVHALARHAVLQCRGVAGR